MKRPEAADSENESDDPTVGLENAALPLGGVLGASLTMSTAAGSLPPWLGALAAALASPAAVLAAKALVQKQSQQVQAAVDAACEAGECTFDQIVTSSMASDRKIDMLANALQGAARSEDDRHVRALGRLLVEGVFAPVGEDAEFARVMTTLVQLDAVDIELLDYLGRESSNDHENAWRSFSLRSRETEQTVVSNLPHLDTVIDSLWSKLVTLGIVSSAKTAASFGDLETTSWHVTRFGHLCVGRLLVEGTASSS